MIDKRYVKDLEKLIARQEKRIASLEKEKTGREIAAAVFAEYFIGENDTIPGGLASDMRIMSRVHKFYPTNNERDCNFVADVDELDYKLLKATVKRLFHVNLDDLRQYGLHLDINYKNDSCEWKDENGKVISLDFDDDATPCDAPVKTP